MSTPINLNKARKARARLQRKQQADENAVRFGRTKSEKEADRTSAEKARRHVDGHQKDDTP